VILTDTRKASIELNYGLISADDHVQEHPEVWTARMSKQKWGGRVPHLERQPDGSDCWVIGGQRVGLSAAVVSADAAGDRARNPSQWQDIPAMAYHPHERLKALDLDRVDYSVLYPTVAGLAGETFGQLDDPELELACVQAYNDWLIEEWASVSSRFIPQCIVPIWPMDRTVAEIRRAVAKGHRGVIYPASPMELRDLPHINEPCYDPLWTTCADLNVPICFHSGASKKIQLQPGQSLSPPVAAAFRGIVRSVSSIAVLANFLFSRVLYRFPALKVVFADSSLGWGAYEIEYADYQADADGLQAEGYPLKPSELFKRQCYFTCSYDRVSLRVRRYLGSTNILWSTHFPVATSTWPNTQQQIELSFRAIGDDEREQILWKNAARLYLL
jgi:predicted TIM-barrel fold metal-dependent hydrolase